MRALLPTLLKTHQSNPKSGSPLLLGECFEKLSKRVSLCKKASLHQTKRFGDVALIY